MKKLRSIQVKYVPATNYKPSRIKLYDSWEHESYKQDIERKPKYKKIIHYNQSLDANMINQAIHYLVGIGFNIVGYSELGDSYMIHVDNWGENYIALK